jgi:TatD DNase family protein
LIDSHAHLTDDKFSDDYKEAIKRAVDAGVKGIVTVLTSPDREPLFRELLENYEFIYGAAGIHPAEAGGRVSWDNIDKIYGNGKVVAVGEIGLDYHYNDNPPKETQVATLRSQLALAKRNDLPVIIHCRDAWDDMLKILKEEKTIKGVMHCFSGSKEMMAACLETGLYISIAAPVTYPNAAETRQVAQAVPADRLLVETDCPYLAPQPMRGKRNEPAFLKYTVEKIAELRKTAVEEIIKITSNNAKTLFGI